MNGFVRNEIFGHVFDGVLDAIITLSDLGVSSDLIERSPEPLTMSFGPEDKELNDEIIGEMKSGALVGEMSVKLNRAAENNGIWPDSRALTQAPSACFTKALTGFLLEPPE